jgi:hypothetical protein
MARKGGEMSLGEVCEHGSLARKCYTCELEERVKALEGKTGFCAQCEAYARRILKLEKIQKAAKILIRDFTNMQLDHNEKLVHHQTFESASKNWDSLLQKPLDFGPLIESLSALSEETK